VRAFDPVGAGFVESLARPGGNITGFVSFEYSMAGKWLETLKLIAPHIVRIAGIRDLASPSEMGMLGAIQAVMPAFAMPFIAIGGRDAADFDRVIEEYAREPNGGLIILPSPNTLVHRRVIMAQAARHRLPAIYPYGFFAREGGLISYGIVPSDNFRRAAAYVDRILKGARPGELPVQVPTKFELVINLKTKEAYRKKILRKAHIRESRQLLLGIEVIEIVRRKKQRMPRMRSREPSKDKLVADSEVTKSKQTKADQHKARRLPQRKTT
jgi:putative tryptophan/tyrosine transport system substrate-binding protein